MTRYSTGQAARILEIRYATLMEAIKFGRIHATKTDDGHWEITSAAIKAYQDRRAKRRENGVRRAPHKTTSAATPVLPDNPLRIQAPSIVGQHRKVSSIERIIRWVRPYPQLRPRVFFTQLPQALIAWIDQQETIIGCVAWLTRRDVMTAIEASRLSMVVVQNEQYLSQFAAVEKPLPDSLYAMYQSVNPSEFALEGSFSIPRYRMCGAVRHRSGGRTLMHHKFLVGCRLLWTHGYFSLMPQSVWYGSWNPTRGSLGNCDSAMILDDATTAEQCAQEWKSLWEHSSPLADEVGASCASR